MSDPLYFPIIKWKQGEQKALQELSPSTRQNIRPILELPPVPQTYDDEPVTTKTCNEHLAKFADTLQRSWNPTDGSICVDARLIESHMLSDGDIHPILNAVQQGRECDFNVVPVTSPGRDNQYKNAVKAVLQNELVIRVRISDLAPGSQALEECLAFYEVAPENVDCIIDLGDMEIAQIDTFLFTASAMLTQIPYIERWRNLVLAGTTFPVNMSGFNSGVGSLERGEWSIWKALQSTNITRKPKFADYGISSAQLIDNINPRFMNPSASIRYTANEEYMIFKGRGLRTQGYEQFHTLSEEIVSHPCYSGPDFSWGDKYIEQCAERNCGSGNPTTWRQVGTNHHIETVVSQISTLYGSSGSA